MPEPLIEEELVELTLRLQHVVNEFLQQIHERIVEVGRADPPERVLDDTATHRRRDGGCARSAGPGADRRGGPQHSSRAGLWAHCGTYRVGFTAADHGFPGRELVRVGQTWEPVAHTPRGRRAARDPSDCRVLGAPKTDVAVFEESGKGKLPAERRRARSQPCRSSRTRYRS